MSQKQNPTSSDSSQPEAAAPPKLQRRDATGHLNPEYAADLLARAGRSTNEHDEDGFVSASGRVRGEPSEELAENLGEAFLESATSREESLTDRQQRTLESESGGPYTITEGGEEFASGTDEMNPPDATREPFPTT